MSLFLNLTKEQQGLPIYRIIKPARLFELFDDRLNTLVHPSKWKDPYENFILKSKVKRKSGKIEQYGFHNHFYGQCWTLNKASDAMWRIYSNDYTGIRIKTTIRKLLASLNGGCAYKPDWFCVVGKVMYLKEKKLFEFANNIYHNGSLLKDDLFNTLLVKRRAFEHESEIRVLYFDDRKSEGGKLFRYKIDPYQLIDQIMLDPRLSTKKISALKNEIRDRTAYPGPIRRSLLYKPPEEVILRDTAV